MLFCELYKTVMKKVTFVGFRGGDRPNPPSGSAHAAMDLQEMLKKLLHHSTRLQELGTVLTWKNQFLTFSYGDETKEASDVNTPGYLSRVSKIRFTWSEL